MQPQQGMAAPAVGPAPIVGPAPANSSAPAPVSSTPDQAQLDPAYQHTGMATASLVLGIVSLPASILNILTLPIPIAAIVLGAVSLKRKKGFALAGIILGVIGIILSVIVLVVGIHILHNKNKSQTVSLNSVSAASGAAVSTPCYKFNLPSEFKSSDLQSSTGCTTSAFNSNGDISVDSIDGSSTGITASNASALLKEAVDKTVASQLATSTTAKVTGSGYLKIDGVDAYESHGTETGGYFSILATMSPKAYTLTDGSSASLFSIGYDSRSNSSGVEQIAKSWHWQ